MEEEYLIEVVSKKMCEMNSSKLSAIRKETNTDDLIICQDDINSCGSQHDNITDVEQKINEKDINDIIKTEEPYSKDAINNGTESELYEIEQNQENEKYENEERRKSFNKTDPENEDCSDFDSAEQENDRENGDGQEVTEVNFLKEKLFRIMFVMFFYLNYIYRVQKFNFSFTCV